MKEIFIACVDGLKGFPAAIEAGYPNTQIQLCIVHMVRHSLNYVSWKQRKEVATDLMTIYQVPTEEMAMPIRDWKSALNQFSIIFEQRLPDF